MRLKFRQKDKKTKRKKEKKERMEEGYPQGENQIGLSAHIGAESR